MRKSHTPEDRLRHYNLLCTTRDANSFFALKPRISRNCPLIFCQSTKPRIAKDIPPLRTRDPPTASGIRTGPIFTGKFGEALAGGGTALSLACTLTKWCIGGLFLLAPRLMLVLHNYSLRLSLSYIMSYVIIAPIWNLFCASNLSLFIGHERSSRPIVTVNSFKGYL